MIEPGDENGDVDYTESEPGGNGPWNLPSEPRDL